MKPVSITREIEMDGAYGPRQMVVEVNAVFVKELQNTTDSHPSVEHEYLDSMEVLDESGHDITDLLPPDTKEYLEKQVMDAR